MNGYRIRRIRSDEWEQAKQLRLDALRDPVAHLAFLQTYEAALATPDEDWRRRTADCAAGERACQLVAVRDEELAGGVVVLVAPPGEPDYLGETGADRRAALVGVFLRSDHRGIGLLERLVDAAVEWVAGLGADGQPIDRLGLFVNDGNSRAIAAYRKCGFAETGRELKLSEGVPVDREMVRAVVAG